MLWIKSLHIIAMVAWFAGLFYLPRLFVYHANLKEAGSKSLFCTMERRLYWFIMTPSAIITILLGVHLLQIMHLYPIPLWLKAKLFLVCLLVIYHVYCAKMIADFSQDKNKQGALFFRWFNEIPTILLISIVFLVVIKPQ